MSDIKDDRIDLKPYFKLLRKTFKSVEKWVYKKIVFVIICFVIIAGTSYTLDALKAPRYEMSTVIDKEFVSSEELKSVLQSMKVNVEASNTPEFFGSFQNKKGVQVKIFKLNYSVLTSFKDSIIIKKVESTLDDLENDGPVKVELVTNFDNDSIGHLFIDYLNSLDYVKNIRNSRVEFLKERSKSLSTEISEIDTIINHLLVGAKNKAISKNERSGATVAFNENRSIIHNLFNQKDELIREREEVSNELKFMNDKEIYPLGEFHRPKEINRFSIYSVKTLVKYLLLSFLIVLLVSFFIKRSK